MSDLRRDGGARRRCDPATPAIDILYDVPVELCTGCARVFANYWMRRGKCPACGSDVCACRDCINSIASLMLGDWHKAGIARPDLAVSWHADTGLQKRPDNGVTAIGAKRGAR